MQSGVKERSAWDCEVMNGNKKGACAPRVNPTSRIGRGSDSTTVYLEKAKTSTGIFTPLSLGPCTGRTAWSRLSHTEERKCPRG